MYDVWAKEEHSGGYHVFEPQILWVQLMKFESKVFTVMTQWIFENTDIMLLESEEYFINFQFIQ